MKYLVFLISLTAGFSFTQIYAQGVLLQCWERVPGPKEKQNIIFQSDGGYIAGNYYIKNGEAEPIRETPSENGDCLAWYPTDVCHYNGYFESGLNLYISLSLVDRFQGVDTLTGFIEEQKHKEKVRRQLHCKKYYGHDSSLAI